MISKGTSLIFCIFFSLLLMTGGCSTSSQQSAAAIPGSPAAGGTQPQLQQVQQYENRGDLVEALQQYEQVLSTDPQNQEALQGKSRVTGKAHALAESHYQIGLASQQHGDTEEARREFNITLRLQPGHPGAIKALQTPIAPPPADVYVLPQSSERKKPAADRTTKKTKPEQPATTGSEAQTDESTSEPKRTEAKGNTGKTDQEGNDTMSATASGQAPEKADHARTTGVDLFEKGKYETAIAEFNTVLKEVPDDPVAKDYLSRSYLQLGISKYKNEDYLKARNYCEQALTYNQHCSQCREYFERSEEKYLGVHYAQGLSFLDAQQLPEAIQQFELVSAVNPYYEEVEKNLNKARNLLEKLKQIEESKGQSSAQK